MATEHCVLYGAMRKDKVKNVPTIEAIRSKLGVGVPGDKESKIFRTVVKEFHQDYKTANGTPGAVFTKWTDPTHQDALRRMAEEFLEVRGWAKRFWPDTAGSGTVKKLKWSENHTQYVSLSSNFGISHTLLTLRQNHETHASIVFPS